MDTKTRHLLLEYYGCDVNLLDDPSYIQQLLEAAARAAQATIVDSVFHQFSPQGVTGIVVVEESHLSVHTWPEAAYAAVDIFSCGQCDPDAAHGVLVEGLKAQSNEALHIDRGLGFRAPSMQVVEHRSHAKTPTSTYTEPSSET